MAERGALARSSGSWGEDLLDVVEAGTGADRFHRGEHLHLDGAVDVVKVLPGSFGALVHADRGVTCTAVLEVQRLTRDELPAAVGALVRDPGWKRPRADGGVLGPDGSVALDTTCTCPDGRAVVCEHAIALAHEVALLIDADPRHWLTARGLPLGPGGVAASPAALHARERPAAGEEPLAALTAEDWFSPRTPVAELPEGRRPRPVPEERDPALLRDAFRAEFLGSGSPDGVEARVDRAVAALEAVYRTLTASRSAGIPRSGGLGNPPVPPPDAPPATGRT